MKKFLVAFFLVAFTATVFGQQFLWTTIKDSATKYVPLESVTDKVLEFYDHYEFYNDGSGYSKAGFFKMFESSKSFNNSNTSLWKGLKNKIYEIDSPTVIAGALMKVLQNPTRYLDNANKDGPSFLLFTFFMSTLQILLGLLILLSPLILSVIALKILTKRIRF